MNAFKGERDVEGAGFIKPVRWSNPSSVLVVTGVPQPNTALWIRHAYWLCLLASESCMQDELGTFWVTGLQTCDPYLIMHWCEWWSLNVNWVCFETVCTSKQHDCPVFFFLFLLQAADNHAVCLYNFDWRRDMKAKFSQARLSFCCVIAFHPSVLCPFLYRFISSIPNRLSHPVCCSVPPRSLTWPSSSPQCCSLILIT